MTTSGGDYQASFDGAAVACAFSDSTYPTLQVTATGPFAVVFQPGTDPNVTFLGPGALTSLDLSAAPAGTTVTINGDTPASPGTFAWAGGTDMFAGVSSFAGSVSGDTDFVAGPDGGYSFTGQGSGNSLDLSAATAAVDVSLPAGTVTGLAGGGTDVFSGISLFIGSPAGGNVFAAGNTPLETFEDPGTAGGDTVDFSAVSSTSTQPLAVNVSGMFGQLAFLPDSASNGSSTYSFLDLGANLTLVASPGATTFYPGNPGAYTFDGAGPSTTLDLSNASGAESSGAVVSVPTGSVTGLPGTNTFSDVSSFVGGVNGDATFIAGPGGGYSFAGEGSGNSLDLSAATAAVDVSVPAGTVTGLAGSGTDVFSGISSFTGSQAGGNVFAAGNGSETFSDLGTVGGDTVDFSAVSSTGAQPLGVNVTGAPLAALAGLPNGQAVDGTSTYAFDELGPDPTFVASPGATTFYAGSGGGYGFVGVSSTMLDLSAAAAGVDVSVPAGTVTGLASGTDTISGISSFVGSRAGGNTFAVSNESEFFRDPGTVGGDTVDFSAVSTTKAQPLEVNESGSQAGVPDESAGIEGSIEWNLTELGPDPTFVASPGATTFDAGIAGVSFDGAGSSSTLDLSNAAVSSPVVVSVPAGTVTGLPGGADTFSGVSSFEGTLAGADTFIAGPGGGYSFTAKGSNNSLDLSAAAAGVDVSVPAGTVTGLPAGGTDVFSGISSFTGSPAGGNTFAAGNGSETFRDLGTAGGDTVDFSAVSSSGAQPLQVNVTGSPLAAVPGLSNGQAVDGTSTYAFDELGQDPTFVASPGSTTFYAGGMGGFTFDGAGLSTTLDLSNTAAGVDVSVPAGTVTGLASGADTISDIGTFVGSRAGGNTFAAGNESELFRDPGTVGGDTVDFSAVSSSGTQPLVVNASGAQVGSLLNGTASNGPSAYDLTALGPDPTFVASPGATTFYAGIAGVSFDGAGSSTTLDLSNAAVSSPVVVSVPAGIVTGLPGGADTFSGVSSFVGTPAGGDTFVAGPAGGYSFTGNATANVLDLSAAPADATLTLNGDSASSPGVVGSLNSGLGGSTTDLFADIQQFQGAITKVATTTSLTLSRASVTFGSEALQTFAVTVAGTNGDGYPQGSVVVSDGATQLCTATLAQSGADAASAQCSLAASQLAAGVYGNVTATFVPATASSSNSVFTYTASASAPPASFTVTAQAETTRTGLTLSSGRVTYGAENSETFTANVTGQSGDGTPIGTVTVANGSATLCTATLTAGSGDISTASCSLSRTQLPAGAYRNISATFVPAATSSSNPSYSYGASSSSPAAALTVLPAPTDATLTLTSPVTYGAEGKATFQLTVTATGATPAGSVTVLAGLAPVCHATLTPNGTGTCTLGATQLRAGDYLITAVYVPGNGNFLPSISPTRQLVVLK